MKTEKILYQIFSVSLIFGLAWSLVHVNFPATALQFMIVIGLIYTACNYSSFFLSVRERLLVLSFLFVFLSTLIAYLYFGFNTSGLRIVLISIAYLGFFPIFVYVKQKGLQEEYLWHGVVLGSIAAGLFFLVQVFVLDIDRLYMGHTIISGDLALLLGFMCIASISYFRKFGRQALLYPLAGSAFGIGASILSGARGGWIALPVFLIILYIFNAKYLTVRIRYLVILTPILFLALLYLVPQFGVKDRVDLVAHEISAYQQGQQRSSSVGSRFEMWKASIELAKESPVLGLGLVKYKENVIRLSNLNDKYDPSVRLFSHPHSEYFLILVERGLLGLIAILSAILVPGWYFFRAALKMEQKSYVAVTGLLVVSGYAVFGLTEPISIRNISVDFYVLLVSILSGYAAHIRYSNS